MFSQKDDVIAAMDEMVVVSLYTDGTGLKRNEFDQLRARLAGTNTNPTYVVVSPWEPEKVLYQADYNQAMEAGFAAKLGQANRRAQRLAAKQAPAAKE